MTTATPGDAGGEVAARERPGPGQPDLGELVEQVESGEMPPTKYTLIHSGASLSSEEKRQLVAALTGLYATDPPPPGGGG